MNVLVSGSRGFIGSALVERLTSQGHTVHSLVRQTAGAGQSAGRSTGEPDEKRVVLDLEARRIDTAALPGGTLASIDVVYHLAGEPITPWRWSAAKRERIRSSRVVTTDVVARSIAASPEPRPVLVAMSAIGFYGDRGDEQLYETSAGGAGTLADICRAWESATAPASEAGARVVNMRTGVVLGPGGGSLRIQLPLFKAGLGGRLGSGRQWTSWISLEDEVGALLHAASESGLSGPCNATSPGPVPNSVLTDVLARAVHRPAVLSVPRPVLELVAGRETTAEFLCASQRALPAKLESSGFHFVHPDVKGAIAAALRPPLAGVAAPGRGPL